MKNKFKSKLGFTLAELLIVIAIIVILVGISIPVFASSTKKANIAVDQANVRAALSEGLIAVMTNDNFAGDFSVSIAISNKIATIQFFNVVQTAQSGATAITTKTVELKYYETTTANAEKSIVWTADKGAFTFKD